MVLKLADVDMNGALITLLGKGSKQRRVPIGKSAIHWLQRYAAVRAAWGHEHKPQFFLQQGRPLTRQVAWAIIKSLATQAGLQEVSPHTLRHSFALTCCNTARTHVRCRRCWAIAIFPPRRFTRTSPTGISAPLMIGTIRDRELPLMQTGK